MFNNCNAFKGEVRDIIKDKYGNVIETTEWSCNTICDGLGILIAALLKGQSGYGTGVYWAVGAGNGWDIKNPPSPSKSDTRLVAEIGRKAISTSNISFLDINGNVTATPTNQILITASFGTNECNGDWMEMGIFSGNATATLNSGTMINHKTHKLTLKDTDRIIDRQVRFTFRQEV
jgi:hypothetical protein